MTVYLLSVYCLFLGSALDTHTSAESEFKVGVQLLQEKKYNESIYIFERLLENGYTTCEVYTNLGVAFSLNGQQGKAILSHYRALRIVPNDKETINNLNILLKKANVSDPEVTQPLIILPFLLQIMLCLSTDKWALIILVVSLSSSMGLILSIFSKNSLMKARLTILSNALILVLLAVTFCVAIQEYYLHNNKEAIIITGKVTTKRAPSISAKDSFILQEGTKVYVLDIFRGWAKVRLSKGEASWVSLNTIKYI
jgi:tetratricopeptide (TPR) repeat protein